MSRLRLLLTTLCATVTVSAAAPLKVATLHPLLADLARQVGGARVEVVDLIGPTGDPHKFEPSQDHLARSRDARLYLLAGMGLESYLPALRSIVGSSATILEVGKNLPALAGACSTCEHGTHDHGNHQVDPHWWHSIDLFRRATSLVAEAFADTDPAGAEFYRANATTCRARLDDLERWSRRQIAAIPRERRHLATAHDAFRYFCRDFGFTPHPVQGLNREQVPDAAALAALIAKLRAEQVAVVFPEKESNPKILAAITRDTGITLGPPLIADGTNCNSYEEMVRHNVSVIVKSLATGPATEGK